MTDPTPGADRRLDDRLAADGARWRAAQPAPPEPDPALLTGRRRSRWQPLAAAAAVVAVAAGGVAGVAVSRGVGSPPAGRTTGQTASPADDIVRDGDRVAGQGYVLALPGRPVQFCGPVGGPRVVSPDPWPDEETVPEPCRNAVTVTGLDLDRLSERTERDGAVWGWARVDGVYRAGTLTVTRQEAYVSTRTPASAADQVPCPEPAGGWPRQPSTLSAAVPRLARVVGQHPDELSELYVTYPYGWHLQDTSDRKGIEVYVVNTTGDVAAARALLGKVFPARHLCVRAATWSKAAMDAAARAVETSAEAKRLHVASPDKDPIRDRVTARVLLVDAEVARFLATVAGGRVVADPVLVKVR